MSNVQIKHQRAAAFTTCNGLDICQIELVSTRYNVKANKADKLKFHREGDEKSAGFDVHIEPPFTTGSLFPGQGNANLDIDIPADQADGDYKYTISYPYDVNANVAPLDPIIIIQPSVFRRLFSVFVTAVIAFAAGATFAQYFL